jgi:DtxR family transcriptional regulator, Mn-dependent transcriptional regulator
MATETVENYLKAIYTLCQESPTGEAGVVRLGAMLGVTKGTATSMVKKLAAGKLVKAERYGGVTLTPGGARAALDVLRRHRLVETFLVQTLKVDWSEVHEDADRLEHALSPRLLDRLDEFLGRPTIDPHGDPIPDSRGNTAARPGEPLSSFAKGRRVGVVRITDQAPAFLSFVAAHGLKPGVSASVLGVDHVAQSITVQARDHRPVVMALAAASRILCVPVRK